MSSQTRPGGLLAQLAGLVFVTAGLLLVIGGVWSLLVGGPLYYLLTGLGLTLTGLLVWLRNPAALVLYALIGFIALVWSFYISGFDFWGLMPRLNIFLILGILLLLPPVTRALAPNRIATGLLGVVVALIGGLLGSSFFASPHTQEGELSTALINPVPEDPEHVPAGEWKAYGRTHAGDRWSPLKQINSDNVGQLKLAWVMHTHDFPQPNDSAEPTNEATPLAFDNTLYFCSLHQKLFAVDGATGKTKWVFDPHLHDNPTYQHLTCRGVSMHETPANAVDSSGQPVSQTDCAKRLVLPVNDGRIIEVDAATGKKCTAFGQDGEVDMRVPFQPYTTPGQYEPTSPPVITDKYVIVNSAITDNGSVRQASGATRAYDIYTGKMVWVFDAANPDPNEMPSPEHPHFHPNSPNSWAISAYDKKLNLVYIPMGIGTPDEWGGYRTKDAERFVPGILALNADTGKLAWFFQTVHHDLWDMDVPAQPSLVDVTRQDGTLVPAIYIPTKTGDIFVLDRRNGQPIVPISEQNAPQTPAPGDWVSPTQPHSRLSLRPKERLSEKDIWGATIFDQMVCNIYFHSLRYDGIYTPPSIQGTLVFPGNLGMFEWGGMGVDPQREVAFVNPISLPFVSQLVPRGPGNPLWPDPQAGAHKSTGETGLQPAYGIPFAIRLHPFLNPLLEKIGIPLPCRTPPWGSVAGLDLRTNKVVWEHPNGTMRDSLHKSSLPLPLPPFHIGVPSLGGPLVTAGNLAVLTSTQDDEIRAYNLTNGKEIWQARLPAGGQATPMTYAINGRQYIVTYAGGHGSFGSRMGDTLLAYALPNNTASATEGAKTVQSGTSASTTEGKTEASSGSTP
ncbi:membrane-bound PQQ-dependent dehydrogenase, glucose/quinate/shikimate family [Oecophyllibacter saccharovorans]|uniref:membrane-bound PQQ-dependent dehydrogenase, glucose/quinate/shikimate family n=1 Tax=Oecophyllibacter saccharovorans TaxID=2558360 RepID=UPI0011734408|nr:membrane-bound PQQ-dependent dehydrogenase, glucose/quinate/shikimate family [Oecophyllibacter saccharovorans]TPW34934.1 membrane-bound PQQ-dependent dehydrogenase, glucose/quinate/shikimate family [Oecophyllibacter saccharovorans]